MACYKRDEVIAVDDNGLFHIVCYDGNLNDLAKPQVLTEHDLNEEDWYFCDKCKKQI